MGLASPRACPHYAVLVRAVHAHPPIPSSRDPGRGSNTLQQMLTPIVPFWCLPSQSTESSNAGPIITRHHHAFPPEYMPMYAMYAM